MRCFLLSLFVLLLILGGSPIARAADCDGNSCASGYLDCVRVKLGVALNNDSLDYTCPKYSPTLDVTITNRMGCKDVFTIRFHFRYHDEQQQRSVRVKRKGRWVKPEIRIPVAQASRFHYVYDLKLPSGIPDGEYSAWVTVTGENSGVIVRKFRKFTVGGPNCT
ncbi:MAG: hypothetical protein ACYTEL_00565 [Planctomycetota bacterium]